MRHADPRLAYGPSRDAVVPGRRSGPVAHGSLAGLAGTDLSERFCYWRGCSGRRYLFSVFRLGSRRVEDRFPGFERAVVLAVAHHRDGERQIIDAGETGERPELYFEGGRLSDALAAGANEIHVHLLTQDQHARIAILGELNK